MSDKQIKIQVSADTSQAKKDVNELLNTAKQPLLIPIKTDSTEAVKSLNDIKNETKLLQTQFQSFKISGDTSSFSNIKSQVQDLATKLKDIPKLDIKGQIQSQGIENSLSKIKKDILDIQSGKIDIKTTMSGSISEQIASVKNSLATIQKNQTVQIVMAGLDGFFGAVGAIKNALGSIYNMAAQPIGNFLSEGYDYVKGIENSTTALTNSLKNSATAQNEANQRFKEGKGTLEDYTTITGKTTESFYENAKASGSAGGSTKAYKIDLSELKGQLLDIKKETQNYNSQLKDQESVKKDLENATKDLIKSYNREVDSIQDTIKSLNDQEKAALIRANSTDNEIKNLEKLIATKQKDIDIDEEKLNKELSKKTKDFDKQNKSTLNQIDKKELALDKQKLEIEKRKNLLDNNPTANANALDQIKNEEEAIRSQTDELRLQKSEISLKRKELISNLETQQQTQRDLIENKKEELDKDKEVADAKKIQNQEIKNQFQEQVAEQKTLIDELKDKIEKANIKLDLDTAPIQAKIDTIKDQIQALQDQSQDVQNEISDKQQAQSEASAASGGGGGGGGGLILNPKIQAEIDKMNQEKRDYEKITEGDVTKRINRVIGESTNFALKTPFEKKDVINLTSQLESLNFNTLKGVEDKEKGISGSKDIFSAGYGNILNVASDFVARRLQITGGSSQEATKDFVRAISQLKSGNTTSFAEQFGTTGPQLLNAAESLGFKLEKQQDLAKLNTEDLTKVLAKTAEKQLIKGSAEAQSNTLAGVESNAKDAFSSFYEQFFGSPTDPKSLAGSIKETIRSITEILSGPDSNELKKSFKELGEGMGDLLKQLVSKENLKATFESLKETVAGMSSYLTPENIKGFASAIGDFVKGIPGVLKTFGDIIEDIAARLGIKTEKAKVQEAKDYFGKKEEQGLFDIYGMPIGRSGDGEITKADKDKKTISIFEENKAQKDKGQIIFGGPSEEDYKKAKANLAEMTAITKKETEEQSSLWQISSKKNADAVNEFTLKGIKSVADFSQNGKINFEDLGNYWKEKIAGMTNNIDKIVIEGGQKFVQLKDGTKISLDAMGADFKNLTDEQIIAKLKTLPIEFETAFKSGKTLSDSQLQELSGLTKISVENLKNIFGANKDNLLNPIKDGVAGANGEQGKLGAGAENATNSIQANYDRINLKNVKNEFLDLGNIFGGLQTQANKLLGQIQELSKNKDGSQANNFGEAVGNFANNFGKEVGVVKKATGGLITGGSGYKDDVPIMAMGGEFVLTKNAVNKYGLDLLNEINQGKLDLNTPKLENIKIPTAPSPRISNTNNNQKNQTQNITNNITVPNSGNFGHNLKTSLVLYAEQLSRSANSGFSNIPI